MRVWVHSEFRVIQDALASLVARLGFQSYTEYAPPVEVALWHLDASAPPYPAPPPVPTLALFSGTPEEVIKLLQRGYRGHLPPKSTTETLKMALEALRRGEIWASRELLTRTLASLAAPQLTEREGEVLDLLGAGLTNRLIAARLGISERTVKAHISNLFDKHGVKNRTELVLQVRR